MNDSLDNQLSDKRPIPLTDEEYDRHVMRHSNRSFSQDFQFLACRYRMKTRKSASRVAYVASSQHDQPTAGDIRQAASHAEGGVNRDRLKSEMESMMRKLIRYGSSMKTTFASILHERRHLFAHLNCAHLDDPTWFVTLSSADLYW